MRYYTYESSCHRSRSCGYRDPRVLLGAGRLIARWVEETFPETLMYVPMVDRSTAAMATAVRMYTDWVEPVLMRPKRNGGDPTTPNGKGEIETPLLYLDDYMSDRTRTLTFIRDEANLIPAAVATIDASWTYYPDDMDGDTLEKHARKALMARNLASNRTRVYFVGSRIPVDGPLLEPVPS